MIASVVAERANKNKGGNDSKDDEAAGVDSEAQEPDLPLYRHAYQARYKLNVLTDIERMARESTADLSMEEKLVAARLLVGERRDIHRVTLLGWWKERDKLRALSFLNKRKLRLSKRKSAFPDVEAELRVWMLEERAKSRRLSRRVLVAHFRKLLERSRGVAVVRTFKYSRAWFRGCMDRIGFSYRTQTRKSSHSLVDRLPVMTLWLARFSRRMLRQQTKRLAVRAATLAVARMANDVDVVTRLSVPLRVLGAADVAPALMTKGAVHDAATSDSYSLFTNKEMQQLVARGEVEHRFGIPPFARFNVDQVPLQLGEFSKYSYDVTGANSVPVLGRHGEHKDSREATAQVCVNASGVPELQAPLVIVFRGQGKMLSQNERAQLDAISARGLVTFLWQKMAWMDDLRCLEWANTTVPQMMKQYRTYLGLPDTERTVKLLQGDGLSGQTTPEFAEALWAHRIKLHLSPSHCTDRLQPVDNGIGQQLKRLAMGDLLDDWLAGDNGRNLDKWRLPPAEGGLQAWQRRVLLAELFESAWRVVLELRVIGSPLNFIATCYVATGAMTGVNNYWLEKSTTLVATYKQTKKGKTYVPLMLDVLAADDADASIDGAVPAQMASKKKKKKAAAPGSASTNKKTSTPAARPRSAGPVIREPQPGNGGDDSVEEDDEDDEEEDEDIEFEENDESDDDNGEVSNEESDGSELSHGKKKQTAAWVLKQQRLRERDALRANREAAVPPPGWRLFVPQLDDVALNTGEAGKGDSRFVGQRVLLKVTQSDGRTTRRSRPQWHMAIVQRVATAADQNDGNHSANFVVKLLIDAADRSFVVEFRNTNHGDGWHWLLPEKKNKVAPKPVHAAMHMDSDDIGGPDEDDDDEECEAEASAEAVNASSSHAAIAKLAAAATAAATSAAASAARAAEAVAAVKSTSTNTYYGPVTITNNYGAVSSTAAVEPQQQQRAVSSSSTAKRPRGADAARKRARK